MTINTIHLTSYQLIRLGAHLGHSNKHTKFLSSWMFGGWRSNIFIFNLIKVIQMFKYSLKMVHSAAANRRPVWFVNFHSKFSGYVARYGYICGEGYNAYWWVAGNLTNFKFIMGWHKFLLKVLLKDIYILRHSDRKLLSSYIGLMNNRRRLPAAGFLPNLIGHLNVAEEFACCNIPTIGVIDSNVVSWNVSLPIPGNDDSMLCVNFYSYLVCRNILSGKVTILHKWQNNIVDQQNLRKSRKAFINLLLLNKNKSNSDRLKKRLLFGITSKLFSSLLRKPSSPLAGLSKDQKIIADPINKLAYSTWSRKVMFPLAGIEPDEYMNYVYANEDKFNNK